MSSLFDKGEIYPQSKATAAPIGSGPMGKTCGECRHCERVSYHGKSYYKCDLMTAHWTHGPASDIRKNYAACREFQPEEYQ